jgi:TPR repeat protein
MAQLEFNDAHIDDLVWHAIAHSPCSKDFESYLALFMKPLHDAEACQQIEHLLHAQANEEATPFFPHAIDALSQLAASGDSNAQFYLGKCHSFGYGVPADYDQAFKQYTLAGLQGDLRAWCNIAGAYYSGIGLGHSYEKAMEYYLKAYAIAHDSLVVRSISRMHINGYGVEKDAAKGIAIMMQEIEHGDYDVLALLGNMQMSGDGIPKNEQEGLRNIRLAAEGGDDYAQYLLAYSYEYGRGLEEDCSLAVHWYKKSAEQHFAAAQECLGTLYLRGEGVAKNGAEGMRLLKIAACNGSASAAYKIGLTFLNGIDAISLYADIFYLLRILPFDSARPFTFAAIIKSFSCSPFILCV